MAKERGRWLRRVLPRLGWFVGTSVLGGGCDLSSKAWAEGSLGSGAMSIIEPWLEFSLSYNRGTAFSVIRDLGAARIAFGVLALVVVVALAVMVWRSKADAKESVALGAIAGGAIGNGVDRGFGGGVVDFIKVNYPWGGSWPTFNIADALIACGAGGMLLLRIWRRRRDAQPEPSS